MPKKQIDGWLYGWKDIAQFYGCDMKTIKKKYKKHGLPIDFDPDGKPIAIPGELKEWLKKNKRR